MRGVGVRVSLRSLLVAGIGVLAAMLPAEAPAVAAGEQAAPPSQEDYYTRRAKTVLEAEKATTLRPHPLAASYPGMDVVVCEAGCPDRAPQVIYLRPQDPSPAEGKGMLLPTSGSDEDGAASAHGVSCVAGCYDETDDESIHAAASPPATALTPWSATVISRDKLSPIR